MFTLRDVKYNGDVITGLELGLQISYFIVMVLSSDNTTNLWLNNCLLYYCEKYRKPVNEAERIDRM